MEEILPYPTSCGLYVYHSVSQEYDFLFGGIPRKIFLKLSNKHNVV